MTVMPVPKPESSASTLTARPRCAAGASSMISAVVTPTTRTSKQTAKSFRKARSASDGAKALPKLTTEKPGRSRQQPERQPKRNPDQRGRERLRPRPPAEPVVEDIRKGPHDEPGRHAPQRSEAALD